MNNTLKEQILKMKEALSQKGMTAIPLKIYLKRNFVKVEIALARGKKFYDKRRASKEKDAKRDMAR